jgi:hypothetical protein
LDSWHQTATSSICRIRHCCQHLVLRPWLTQWCGILESSSINACVPVAKAEGGSVQEGCMSSSCQDPVASGCYSASPPWHQPT